VEAATHSGPSMGGAGRRRLGLAAPERDCERLMEHRRHSCSLSAGCHPPSPIQANARRTTINARQPPLTADRYCRKLWPSRQDILSIPSFSRCSSLQPRQEHSLAQSPTSSHDTCRRRQGSQENNKTMSFVLCMRDRCETPRPPLPRLLVVGRIRLSLSHSQYWPTS
jgi:hypothetical protein